MYQLEHYIEREQKTNLLQVAVYAISNKTTVFKLYAKQPLDTSYPPPYPTREGQRKWKPLQ